MRLMRMLGVALLWAVGVALVASMSWVAINSAGRQVVETTIAMGASGTDAQAGGPADPSGPAPSTVTSLAPPSSITKSGPTPSGPDAHRTASTIAPTPTGPSSSGHVAPRTSPGGDSASPSSTVAPPSPVSDTLSTPGGVVWLQCTGYRVTDYLAQPSSDWAGMAGLSIDRTSFMVDFVHQTTGIRIVGSCTSGQPRFGVTNYNRGGGGGDHHGGDD